MQCLLVRKSLKEQHLGLLSLRARIFTMDVCNNDVVKSLDEKLYGEEIYRK